MEYFDILDKVKCIKYRNLVPSPAVTAWNSPSGSFLRTFAQSCKFAFGRKWIYPLTFLSPTRGSRIRGSSLVGEVGPLNRLKAGLVLPIMGGKSTSSPWLRVLFVPRSTLLDRPTLQSVALNALGLTVAFARAGGLGPLFSFSRCSKSCLSSSSSRSARNRFA